MLAIAARTIFAGRSFNIIGRAEGPQVIKQMIDRLSKARSFAPPRMAVLRRGPGIASADAPLRSRVGRVRETGEWLDCKQPEVYEAMTGIARRFEWRCVP